MSHTERRRRRVREDYCIPIVCKGGGRRAKKKIRRGDMERHSECLPVTVNNDEIIAEMDQMW